MGWLTDTGLQPPSGWTFKDERFGVPVTGQDYKTLLTAAARQRAANNLEIGDVEKDVNEYLCAHNPPNFCQRIRGAGDIAHLLFDPIARGIDAVAGTNLSGCGGCAQRREALNEALPL